MRLDAHYCVVDAQSLLLCGVFPWHGRGKKTRSTHTDYRRPTQCLLNTARRAAAAAAGIDWRGSACWAIDRRIQAEEPALALQKTCEAFHNDGHRALVFFCHVIVALGHVTSAFKSYSFIFKLLTSASTPQACFLCATRNKAFSRSFSCITPLLIDSSPR